MLRLILRRLAFLPAVTVAITGITFVLLHDTGTVPAQLMAGPHGTADQIRELRHRFGLDQPLPVQYLYRSPPSSFCRRAAPCRRW
jgi:peptide/nickel transport system permease protein